MSGYETYTPNLEFAQSSERIRSEINIKTWLAEVLDGQMYNKDEYFFDGQELYGGDGSPLRNVFLDGIDKAEELAEQNSAFDFELRRRKIEMEEYDLMLQMANDEAPNTAVIVSDFPPELMNATEDIGGYSVARKQTMLRVITKNEEGGITVESQSLDGSNRRSLEAIYDACEREAKEGELLGQRILLELDSHGRERVIDDLRRVYDISMGDEFGGNWYAGRPHELGDSTESTLEFVEAQKDILQHAQYQYGELDFNNEPDQQILARIAATISDRYEKALDISVNEVIVASGFENVQAINLESEIWNSMQRAVSSGKTFSGCGSSISVGESSIAETSLSGHGYGNKLSKESLASDQYGSLTFKCQKGHLNTRPRGKLIDCCKTCGIDVSC